MLLKSIEKIPTFVAGDLTILREVLHPEKDNLDLPYSLAHALISPGLRSLPHKLHAAELYIFLSGNGQIVIDNESREVKANDIVLVPAFAEQFVINNGDTDLIFYCIVSPPWQEQGEEIIDKS